MKYYEEIMKELDEAPVPIKETCRTMFFTCSQYLQLYRINQKLTPIKPILQGYFSSEDYEDIYWLTKKRTKDSTKDTCKEIIDPRSKYLIEFLWIVYKHCNKKNTEKDFFSDVIAIVDDEKRKDIIQDLVKEAYQEFSDEQNIIEKYLKQINPAIRELIEKSKKANVEDIRLSDLKLENLEKTFQILKEAFNTPLPDIEESVTEIIDEDFLSKMLQYAQDKNYPACTFMAAPIKRALTIGEPKSFAPDRGAYFRHAFEYNKKELEKYIEGIKDFLEFYEPDFSILKGLEELL